MKCFVQCLAHSSQENSNCYYETYYFKNFPPQPPTVIVSKATRASSKREGEKCMGYLQNLFPNSEHHLRVILPVIIVGSPPPTSAELAE